MQTLKTQISNKIIAYDGTQLSPHWIYRNFEILGNALVAFVGAADVTLDHMVDLEDVARKAPIYSPNMLHFIGEWFVDSLMEGILLQHLFVCEVYEILLENKLPGLRRTGNDIYVDGRKLSVSIATKSPVSVLIHMGINIETHGTPIPTSGLFEMGLDPYTFASEVLNRFTKDHEIWMKSRVKVSAR